MDECLECRGRLSCIDITVALAVYDEPLRSAIHKLKYGNGWRLARPLGAMAATRLAPLLGSSKPLVTFVPMHRRRRRARGYDHAEKLAFGVARALGLRAVRMLERTRSTQPQANLDQGHRRSNVREAFKAFGGEIEGEEVILVDDVLTTGYTLSECARTLRRAGAARIIACVLARDLILEPVRVPEQERLPSPVMG